jgi:hypothetical protein
MENLFLGNQITKSTKLYDLKGSELKRLVIQLDNKSGNSSNKVRELL